MHLQCNCNATAMQLQFNCNATAMQLQLQCNAEKEKLDFWEKGPYNTTTNIGL